MVSHVASKADNLLLRLWVPSTKSLDWEGYEGNVDIVAGIECGTHLPLLGTIQGIAWFPGCSCNTCSLEGRDDGDVKCGISAADP
jgi:hypothetical protein